MEGGGKGQWTTQGVGPTVNFWEDKRIKKCFKFPRSSKKKEWLLGPDTGEVRGEIQMNGQTEMQYRLAKKETSL